MDNGPNNGLNTFLYRPNRRHESGIKRCEWFCIVFSEPNRGRESESNGYYWFLYNIVKRLIVNMNLKQISSGDRIVGINMKRMVATCFYLVFLVAES